MLENNRSMLEHNTKFLVDLYMNIARTTLSIGATGFMEIIKQKFEISYPQGMGMMQQNEDKSGGLFKR